MSYQVKEIFYSLQGEGLQAGRPAIFIRFCGCNLWSGRETDRHAPNTICHFCDTDFRLPAKESGGQFSSAAELADRALSHWPDPTIRPYIIFTGGEPLLQLDRVLCDEFHNRGAIIGCETNGTIATTLPLDWLAVSPKIGAPLNQKHGNELKIVFPQSGLNPQDYCNLSFDYFFLQPCDNDHAADNLRQTVDYCQKHPQWRLSIQLHKVIGVE